MMQASWYVQSEQPKHSRLKKKKHESRCDCEGPEKYHCCSPWLDAGVPVRGVKVAMAGMILLVRKTMLAPPDGLYSHVS